MYVATTDKAEFIVIDGVPYLLLAFGLEWLKHEHYRWLLHTLLHVGLTNARFQFVLQGWL